MSGIDDIDAAASAVGGALVRRMELLMIILGVILLVVGFAFSVPILWTIGMVLLAVGVALLIVGATGRAIAGRRYWC